MYLFTVIGSCFCDSCNVEIFPNFYIKSKKKFITNESIKNDRFIYLNGNHIFDQNLLLDFDQQLIKNNVSFDGYTSAYNGKIAMINERESEQLKNVYNPSCET